MPRYNIRTMPTPSLRLSFAQVDVFTSRPFEGNSLAVFADGHALSDQQMQTMAREMNLSETTFILPRDPDVERERGVRVRIFTVQEELPFAGHPTLGTAFWLRGSTGAKGGRTGVERGPGACEFYGNTRPAGIRGDDAGGPQVWRDTRS
jgi:predicted PhzF superfamily epimerase YddE/YHI9